MIQDGNCIAITPPLNRTIKCGEMDFMCIQMPVTSDVRGYAVVTHLPHIGFIIGPAAPSRQLAIMRTEHDLTEATYNGNKICAKLRGSRSS